MNVHTYYIITAQHHITSHRIITAAHPVSRPFLAFIGNGLWDVPGRCTEPQHACMVLWHHTDGMTRQPPPQKRRQHRKKSEILTVSYKPPVHAPSQCLYPRYIPIPNQAFSCAGCVIKTYLVLGKKWVARRRKNGAQLASCGASKMMDTY